MFRPDYEIALEQAQAAKFQELQEFIENETTWFVIEKQVSASDLDKLVAGKELTRAQADLLQKQAEEKTTELKKIIAQELEASAFLRQIPLDKDQPFADESEMEALAERVADAFKAGQINRKGLESIVKGLQRRENLQDEKRYRVKEPKEVAPAAAQSVAAAEPDPMATEQVARESWTKAFGRFFGRRSQ